MSITREEIRQLCIAHDRFMAEQASEPIRRPPVSETGDALVYKEFDNGALAPAPQADAAALFSDQRDETFAQAMGQIVAHERALARKERDQALAERDAKIARLEGKVEALLTMIGKGEVVDLPRGFWRRDHAA